MSKKPLLQAFAAVVIFLAVVMWLTPEEKMSTDNLSLHEAAVVAR